MSNVNIKAGLGIALFGLMLFACNKPAASGNNNQGNTGGSDTSYDPVDPSTAASIGFFLDAWQPKTFTTPASYKDTSTFSGDADATVTVDMNNVITRVSPCLFGNNSNLWMTQIVDQPALMGYLESLAPPILRGPGGSISDMYFWNQSAAPPSDAPDTLLDSNGNPSPASYWYGQNTASWTLSLNNYYALLQQTGSAGLLTVNYAYARYGTGPHPVETAAHLAADWVRYDNGRTKYWEIGNEDYGNWEAGFEIDTTQNHDGQPAVTTGTLYGQHFNIFADSMRAAAKQTGAAIYIGAQLLDAPPASWEDATEQRWNAGVLSEAGSNADFFIVHDYFTAYNTNSDVRDILASADSVPAGISSYLSQQLSQYGVAAKPFALTEWNIQATGSMQNVSYIAGVHAAITLGELIKNKIGEASRWDLANGWSNGDDMGMFNIGDEPGAALWNPRPAFYYMYYFRHYFGDRMVAAIVQGNVDILCYASSFSSGAAGIVIVNKGSLPHNVAVTLQHFPRAARYYWYQFTGGSDNGNFSRKVYINGNGPAGISGGPAGYQSIVPYSSSASGNMLVTAPPYSVIYLQAVKE